MKKLLALLLSACFFLLCSCSFIEQTGVLQSDNIGEKIQQDKLDENSNEAQKKEDKVLLEYLENVQNEIPPNRQVGEQASFVKLDGDLVAYISYPETECNVLDTAITNWINEKVKYYADETKAHSEDPNNAELSVWYESYMAGKNLVSVKLSGSYFSQSMAHPEDVLKTFVYNTDSNRIIEMKDLFEKDAVEAFTHVVLFKTGVDRENNDGHLLDNFVVRDNGVEIILKRGKYLPMSDGTKTVFFKHEEIMELLKEEYDFASVSEEYLPSGEDAQDVPDVPGTEAETEQGTIPPESDIDPSKPMLALTFDDGPSAHTETLLNHFKECGGKGTFFVIGNLIDNRKSTLKRIVSEGHEVAGHSWNHRQLTNLSEDEIVDQLMMTRAKIYDVTGVDTKIMRPPYGAINDDVKKVGKDVGISFINWNVDTLDWKTRDADAVYNEIINGASDGAIILCHDLHKTTVEAMKRAIPKLIEDGYQLVTVSELMAFSDNSLEAGEIYYRQ